MLTWKYRLYSAMRPIKCSRVRAKLRFDGGCFETALCTNYSILPSILDERLRINSTYYMRRSSDHDLSFQSRHTSRTCKQSAAGAQGTGYTPEKCPEPGKRGSCVELCGE